MQRNLTQWLKQHAGLLAVLVIAFALYAASFSGALVVDDIYILKDNPYIDHANFARYFSSGFWDNTIYQGESTPMYRPLVLLVFWLLHQAWGSDPLGYHIALTLLHLANTCLVYVVARKLFSATTVAATLAAAVFALHPTRVESVAWISGIPDPLVTFFLLVALLAHRAFGAKERKWGYLVVAACAFQAALWSKEVAVIFPLVALAIDWVARRRIERAALGVYLLLLAGYFVARSYALGSTGLLQNVHPEQFSRAFDLSLGYAGMLLFPWQVPFYLQPPMHAVASLAGWCALALLLGAIVFGWRRSDAGGRKQLLAALAWLAGFSWTAILMMFYLEGFYSARFLYVPLAGLAWLAALLYDRLVGPRPGLKMPVLIAGACVIAAFGYVTSREIALWHDDATVYQRMVKVAPEGTVGFLNLGYTLMDTGDYARAEENFQVALQNAKIPRVRAEALVALGTVAGMQQQLSRSSNYLNQAVQADPNNSMAWTGLGNLVWMGGRPDQAIPLYERALAIKPHNYEAAMNLANVYQQTGQAERAESIKQSIRK